MPSPQQTALAALFMWVFITSGLVSDTLSYTCAHSAPHLDTLTSGLSVCGGGGASDPGCEVCNDRLGRDGGVGVPWFTEEADKGLG